MKRLILILGLLSMVLPSRSQAQDAAQVLESLRSVYTGWRNAMIKKDAATWKRLTSTTRQTNVRNTIWSERRPFPDAVFAAPAAPPTIANLTPMAVRVLGPTAKAVYFGKVDFGIGGEPTDNLYIISYENEGQGWKYHGAEFVNLGALPDVRKQLQAGDKKFLEGPDFQPTGTREPAPMAIGGPVKYIAKAYVYCPGREVNLLINKTSRHLFQNTKRADVVIGGAKDGLNEMQFSIKDIPGGDPKAPITVRIYLMSEVDGTKPLKPLEYQIEDGSRPKESGTLNFVLTPEMALQLKGR